jgi:hypothetical protein
MNRTGRKTWYATLPISASNMWVLFPFFLHYFSYSSSTVLTQNLEEGSEANRDLVLWPVLRCGQSERRRVRRLIGNSGGAGFILAMNSCELASDHPGWDSLAEEHRRTASRGGVGAQPQQCHDDGHGRREFPWEGPRRATMYQSSSR